MYSVVGLGEMIADRVRMDAYARALECTIKPGAVVADLGAGTGIMSLLACKLGAARVYAIEPSPAALLIPELARENGCADRIVVLRKRSTEVQLPERVDVLVSDMRGVLPAFQRHLADIEDARTRLLAPAGTLIPATDTLWVAPVTAEAAYAEPRQVWQSSPHGVSLRAGLRALEHAWTKHRPGAEALLSDPVAWASIAYGSPLNPHVRGTARCAVVRAATAHGLLVWFDSVLARDIGFSNHPGKPRAIYGQAFFPWPRPIELEPGDLVTIELRADPVGSDSLWTWTTELCRAAQPDRPAERFRQSEFLALPLAAETLRKRAETFQPELGPQGTAALFALERMRQGTSLGAVAAELHSAFPDQFGVYAAALDFASDLSERYAS